MRKKSSRLMIFVLSLAMVITFMTPVDSFAGTTKKYVTREYALKQIEKIIGAKKKAESIDVKDIGDKSSSVYKTMSVAVNAGLVTPDSRKKLSPKTNATYGYVSNVLAKVLEKDAASLCPKKNMSKKLTKTTLNSFLKNKFPNQIKSSSTKIKKGNAVISKPLTISNKTIKGSLVIGDGVGTGEVTLDNVKVTGKMIVRGGGENSIILKGSSSVSQILVRQVNNKVSIKIKDDSKIKMIYINDGSKDVNIVGTVGTLNVVDKDINVSLSGAKVDNLNVTSDNAKVTVDKDSTVKTATLDAAGTAVTGEGKVDTVNVNADDTTVTVPTDNITVADGVAQPKTTEDSTSDNSGTKIPDTNDTASTDDRFETGYPKLLTDKEAGTLTVVYKLKDGVATTDHPADIYNVISMANYNCEADTTAILHGHLGVTKGNSHDFIYADKCDFIEITDAEEHSVIYDFQNVYSHWSDGLAVYSVIDCDGKVSEKPSVERLDRDTTKSTVADYISAGSVYLNKNRDKVYLYIYGSLDVNSISGSATDFKVKEQNYTTSENKYFDISKVDVIDSAKDYNDKCIVLSLSNPIDEEIKSENLSLEYSGNSIKNSSGTQLDSFNRPFSTNIETNGSLSADKKYAMVQFPVSTVQMDVSDSSSEITIAKFILNIDGKPIKRSDYTTIASNSYIEIYLRADEELPEDAELSVTINGNKTLLTPTADEFIGSIKVSELQHESQSDAIIGAVYSKSNNRLSITLSEELLNGYSGCYGCNFILQVNNKEYVIRGNCDLYNNTLRFSENNLKHIPGLQTADSIKLRYVPQMTEDGNIFNYPNSRLSYRSGKLVDKTDYMDVEITD